MNYKHIYLEIIRKAKNEQIIGNRPLNKYNSRRNFKDYYFEFHHILPKSIFPKFQKIKKNLVPLTAKEHFVCHKLLTKIYPSREMFYALLRLCNKRKDMHNIIISANEYEKIRLNVSKFQSEYLKNHIITEEQRNKISNTLKRVYSERKYIPHNKNNNLSDDTKEKISNNLKEQYKNGKIEVWNKNKKCPNLAKIKEDNWIYSKHWYNNGKISIIAETCPEGFIEGHLFKIDKNIEEKRKEKIAKNSTGRHWYNNGKINKFCYECPEGFVKGFLDPRWIKNDKNTR